MKRLALVGETMEQAREVMVFGESGILAISPPDRRPSWIAGRNLLAWPNGAEAQVLSAHDPESLRGRQFAALWADELASRAVHLGANTPDPQAVGRQLLAWSQGTRDDLIQMHYCAPCWTTIRKKTRHRRFTAARCWI